MSTLGAAGVTGVIGPLPPIWKGKNEVPGTWLNPGPDPAALAISGESQWMEESLSLRPGSVA